LCRTNPNFSCKVATSDVAAYRPDAVTAQELRFKMALGAEETSGLPAQYQDNATDSSTSAEKALPSSKRPPPETPQNARTRTLVVASFWAVVLFLGLPVWWWTTSIHRAHLPLQEMLEWADGKVWLAHSTIDYGHCGLQSNRRPASLRSLYAL
jgi:hypothetical protein